MWCTHSCSPQIQLQQINLICPVCWCVTCRMYYIPFRPGLEQPHKTASMAVDAVFVFKTIGSKLFIWGNLASMWMMTLLIPLPPPPTGLWRRLCCHATFINQVKHTEAFLNVFVFYTTDLSHCAVTLVTSTLFSWGRHVCPEEMGDYKDDNGKKMWRDSFLRADEGLKMGRGEKKDWRKRMTSPYRLICQGSVSIRGGRIRKLLHVSCVSDNPHHLT